GVRKGGKATQTKTRKRGGAPPKGARAEAAGDREGATSLGPSPEEARRRCRRHPHRNSDAGGPAARRGRQVGKRADAAGGVATPSARIGFEGSGPPSAARAST